jgi:SH3-like domain-containing protein
MPAMILSRLVAGAPLVLTCVLTCAQACAADFRSIGAPSVVLYDAPSTMGGKRYIAPRGMPVEIVARYGDWVKIRDADGELAWTESKGLSARRNVVVKALSATLRAVPDDNAASLMTADTGVLLELVDPQATGWVSVRHQDGIAGFVRANEIWGI